MKSTLAKYPHAVMTLLLLIAGIASIAWGEKMSAFGGLGWDGQFYAALTQNFPQEVFVKHMDTYHTQRIVPSGIVHYALSFLGEPLDNAHIIRGFEVYNLLLLLLASYLWKLISDEMALSLRGRWLGFTGLFVSFAMLKMGFYYALLTDITAFTLGMGMLYFYLKDRPWGLLAVTLIGAFTWPSMIYGGAILILFPRTGNPGNESGRPGNSRFGLLVASLAGAALLGVILFFYYVKGVHTFGWDTTPTVERVVYLSMFLAVAYVFTVTRTLLGGMDLREIWSSVRSLRPGRVALALSLLAGAKLLLYLWADPGKKAYGLLHLVKGTSMVAISRPLLFLVAHVVYYGPIVLLLVILWKPYCRNIWRYGFGLTLFMMLNMPLTLTSESRGAIAVLPFFVAFLVPVVERLQWRASYYWVVGGMALVFSKVWFTINNPNIEGEILKFPAQNLFMNIGPWMANGPYLVQGGVALITALALYWMVRIKPAIEPSGDPSLIGLQAAGMERH
jgi:hypothetical protein